MVVVHVLELNRHPECVRGAFAPENLPADLAEVVIANKPHYTSTPLQGPVVLVPASIADTCKQLWKDEPISLGCDGRRQCSWEDLRYWYIVVEDTHILYVLTTLQNMPERVYAASRKAFVIPTDPPQPLQC
jgi:hypothetical protein